MLKFNKKFWLHLGIFGTIFSIVLNLLDKFSNGLMNFYLPIAYFYLLTGFSFLYFFYYPKQTKQEEKKMYKKNSTSFWKNKNLIFLFLSILVFFSFSIHDLNKGITVDEPRWINVNEKANIKIAIDTTQQAADVKNLNEAYNRAGHYWEAYLSGDLKSTYNQSNPCATLNFIHLLGYMFKNFDFQTYLFFSRLAIILHNTIVSLLLIYFLSKIFSKNQAIFAGILIFTSPFFIGFSQIVNHDSIQGLYIINTIITLIIALKKEQKKYFIISGIFYSLAVFTQYKSMVLMPLIYFIPILLNIIKNDKKNYTKILWNNLFIFFVSAFFTGIVILPALIYFPARMWQRLFYYPKINIFLFGLVILLNLLIYHKKSILNLIIDFFKFYEKFFVRFTILLILGLGIAGFIYFKDSVNYIYTLDFYYYWNALLGSINIVYFSLPEYLLIIMLIWMFYYLFKPRYDLNFFLFTFFWFCIISATFMTFYWERGFRTLGTRYIYIYIFSLFISLAAIINFNFIKKFLTPKHLKALFLLIILCSILNNLYVHPYYIFDNNIFLNNKYLLTQTTWGTDIVETSQYLNDNFENYIKVYNPRDGLKNFTNPNIEIIHWKKRFWEENPDYIIAGWEKNFVYTPILDYYRYNKVPIWKHEINSQIFTAIYKFDPNLNYERILSRTEYNYTF